MTKPSSRAKPVASTPKTPDARSPSWNRLPAGAPRRTHSMSPTITAETDQSDQQAPHQRHCCLARVPRSCARLATRWPDGHALRCEDRQAAIRPFRPSPRFDSGAGHPLDSTAGGARAMVLACPRTRGLRAPGWSIPGTVRRLEGSSSIGRVPVSKTGGWGFESLLPCVTTTASWSERTDGLCKQATARMGEDW